MIITESSTEYYHDEQKRPLGDASTSSRLETPEAPPSYESLLPSGRNAQTNMYSSASSIPGPSRSPNTDVPVASSSSSGGLFDKLKNIAPGVNPEKLLNPPPPCFHRKVQNVSQTPFSPMSMLGFGSKLNKGFPMLPPPTHIDPHPFQLAGSLNGTERLVQASAIPRNLPIVGLAVGLLVPKGIERRMLNNKEEPVSVIVDYWNSYFFHIRCLHVTLAQGQRCITGPTGSIPPDMEHLEPSQLAQHPPDEQYDSSDSEDSEQVLGRMNQPHLGLQMNDRRQLRREMKAAQREVRRAWKQEMRELKRMQRHNVQTERDVRHLKVRLVVSHFQPRGH
ncbi:hypothetical protein ABKN59_003523 [Abortiporus biennis]